MRQAGRYLPEYRALRQRAGSFLELCYSPQLARDVTLQPLARFDLDAAILFSDILVVPHAMGLELTFIENEGPRLETVSSIADVERLDDSGRNEKFDCVASTVRLVAADIAEGKTLIGFCGAPWTVASYMIEGGSSDREMAKSVALASPEWFEALMAKLVKVSVSYLLQQIHAGAQVVQIFDSWAGELPVASRERWVTQPIAEMVAGVRDVFPGFPVIVFARGVAAGHADVALETGANCVSIEQGVRLDDVVSVLPDTVAVQGNLDPAILLGSRADLIAEVNRICSSVPMKRHIFNLGHGIGQTTDPEAVSLLIQEIRRHDGHV